jgi:Tfp pilus assembly protein PilZ
VPPESAAGSITPSDTASNAAGVSVKSTATDERDKLLEAIGCKVLKSITGDNPATETA